MAGKGWEPNFDTIIYARQVVVCYINEFLDRDLAELKPAEYETENPTAGVMPVYSISVV